MLPWLKKNRLWLILIIVVLIFASAFVVSILTRRAEIKEMMNDAIKEEMYLFEILSDRLVFIYKDLLDASYKKFLNQDDHLKTPTI